MYIECNECLEQMSVPKNGRSGEKTDGKYDSEIDGPRIDHPVSVNSVKPKKRGRTME